MVSDLKIVYVPTKDLIFAEYNPRKVTEKEFFDLRENIKTFGFVDPVLVNGAKNRKNVIIGGHFRIRVALDLKIKEVPVVYLNIPDIQKEKQLNIRLNKNTGEWDFDVLANNFSIEELTEYGFQDFELGFMKEVDMAMDQDDLTKTMDSYLDGNIKQIVLYFSNVDYEKIIQFLNEVMKQEGVDSHTDAFLKMKEHYEKTVLKT